MLSAGIRNPGAGFTQYVLEVLRIRFLLGPAPEPDPLTKELDLELLGSGSLLDSDPTMDSALGLHISNTNSGGCDQCDFMQSELN